MAMSIHLCVVFNFCYSLPPKAGYVANYLLSCQSMLLEVIKSDSIFFAQYTNYTKQ